MTGSVLASAGGVDYPWRTKSLEWLTRGGKSKATRKEKLPLGWKKWEDGKLERDNEVGELKNTDR